MNVFKLKNKTDSLHEFHPSTSLWWPLLSNHHFLLPFWGKGNANPRERFIILWYQRIVHVFRVFLWLTVNPMMEQVSTPVGTPKRRIIPENIPFFHTCQELKR
jgi:hypothetical protein